MSIGQVPDSKKAAQRAALVRLQKGLIRSFTGETVKFWASR